MTSFQGKLFAGTGTCFARADTDADSSLGRVYALQSGQVVSHEHDIGGDWAHLVAVRHGQNLSLYVNGKLSGTTLSECNTDFNLTNHVPLQIGFGAAKPFSRENARPSPIRSSTQQRGNTIATSRKHSP